MSKKTVDTKTESLKIGKFSTKYDSLYKEFATKYGLDWIMLKTIAYIESNEGLFKTTSVDGLSLGLMQITRSTAKLFYKRVVTDTELLDDRISIDIACMLLKQNVGLFGTNIKYIVMGYNQNAYDLKKNPPIERSGAINYWTKYQKYNAEIKKSYNI